MRTLAIVLVSFFIAESRADITVGGKVYKPAGKTSDGKFEIYGNYEFLKSGDTIYSRVNQSSYFYLPINSLQDTRGPSLSFDRGRVFSGSWYAPGGLMRSKFDSEPREIVKKDGIQKAQSGGKTIFRVQDPRGFWFMTSDAEVAKRINEGAPPTRPEEMRTYGMILADGRVAEARLKVGAILYFGVPDSDIMLGIDPFGKIVSSRYGGGAKGWTGKFPSRPDLTLTAPMGVPAQPRFIRDSEREIYPSVPVAMRPNHAIEAKVTPVTRVTPTPKAEKGPSPSRLEERAIESVTLRLPPTRRARSEASVTGAPAVPPSPAGRTILEAAIPPIEIPLRLRGKLDMVGEKSGLLNLDDGRQFVWLGWIGDTHYFGRDRSDGPGQEYVSLPKGAEALVDREVMVEPVEPPSAIENFKKE